MRFNWLHITDLHHGMFGQGWLLPGVKHRFFDDLEYLYPECGPWDLILFTGDLSQKGTSKEFTAVDELLAELRDKLRELQPGHDPVLLAVPGNHDLARPKDTDEALALVESWENSPRNRRRLWEGDDPLLHKTVSNAFKAYGDWWGRQPVWKAPAGVEIKPGRLPGDFAATIEKDGCRLGILGLNSAFLQLAEGDFEGRLAVHADQFNAEA